jgi:hypothetical protein
MRSRKSDADDVDTYLALAPEGRRAVLRTDVLNAHLSQLADLDVGKGCIRYRNPAAVDFTVVRSMLTAVAASQGPVC